MQDDKVQNTEQPNQQRRRFTKGGLAAPVVLATLASKPVLGASFSYQCTVSGKLSGNTSSHGTSGTCALTGVKTADQWKVLTPVGNWPSQAINDAGTGARAFDNTPKGVAGANTFNNVYFKPDNSKAKLLDVLNGNLISGAPNPALGKEAVAAMLNALSLDALGGPTNFPIKAIEVARLFNGVIGGGTVEATATFPGKMWGAAEVLAYFQCINGSGVCPVSIPALP